MSTRTGIDDLPRLSDEEREALDGYTAMAGVPETKSLNTIADRVHEVREDLFDSTAIIDIARRAVSPDTDWYLHHALQVVLEQIDSVCTTLELIAGDAGDVQEVAHG